MSDNHSIRSHFPLLSTKSDNKSIIYFDSACMALRPQEVIDSVVYYYSELSSCGGHGRSSHPLAHEVTNTVERTRKKIANWINAYSEDEVLFMKNTTEGMNTSVMGHRLTKGSNIVTTAIDHHSSSLPVIKASPKIDVKIISPDINGGFSLDSFSEAINKDTQLVVFTIASNVTGEIAPVREISKIAHENEALVIADAAQYAPHRKIDVQELGVDMIAFSIHKLGGPSGMGILWGRYDILEQLNPLMVGGETVEDVKFQDGKLLPKYLPPPAKFEAGLSNYAGIFGTEAIIDFIHPREEQIYRLEHILNRRLSKMFQEFENIKIMGNLSNPDRLPLVSFYLPHIASQDIALYMGMELPRHQIMMRAGVHCAAPLHYALNLNPSKGEGSARLSLAYYNTKEELLIFEDSFNEFNRLTS
ncbi:MAG: aminotransferase class V-fold PLP-dependent enzyme [Candidatus Kariarchaeaceae archaeon]